VFPQRNRHLQQAMLNYPSAQQMYQPQMISPQRQERIGLFDRSRFRGYSAEPYQMANQYSQQSQIYNQQQIATQQYQQPPTQSFFRDAQGKLDFNKIGGGVQTAIGLVNQVSPMLKMLGGFVK